MSLEVKLVNLGEYPNDGTGDDLRTAFEKINDSLSSIGSSTILTATNIGNGVPIWVNKNNNSLQFRSITSVDDKISISSSDTEIVLAVKDFLVSIEDDPFPKLGGNLNLNNYNIFGTGDLTLNGALKVSGPATFSSTVNAPKFEGTLTGNVNGQVSDISNHNLWEFADVSKETPLAGLALVWNGVTWAPNSVVTDIVAGNNVEVTALGDGKLSVNVSGIVTDIVAGNNVEVTALGDGKIVIDATDRNLSELPDTDVTAPTTGQFLQYNGNAWTNVSLPYNLMSYDFGVISGIRTPADMILHFTPVDFGPTITTVLNNLSMSHLDLGIFGPIVPEYSLIANPREVDEGNTVKIFLITSNVADGTVVPYQISGIEITDLYGVNSLTGAFMVENRTSSVEIPIKANLIAEFKQLTLTLIDSPKTSISVKVTDFKIPDTFDGGVPESTFEVDLDNGVSSDLVFTFVADAGVVTYSGEFKNYVNGGSPFDAPTEFINCGFEISMLPAILNGGGSDIDPAIGYSVSDGGSPSDTLVDEIIDCDSIYEIDPDTLDGGLV